MPMRLGNCRYPAYQFEAIHPFLDGNGRIGRLLISFLLVYWGVLSFPLLYLSAYFEAHRDDYYRLLLAVSERGAWRNWVLFFLRGVAEQARDASARARELRELHATWRRLLQEAHVVGTTEYLVDLLFEQPIVSPRQAQERLNVSHQTAMAALRRLESLGILREATGQARNRLYVAEDILHIIE